MSSTELVHYGVKGMRWGVRRYQNKDGSLTPAGYARKTREDLRAVGVSKSIANREGRWRGRQVRQINKVNAAIDRINANQYTGKQHGKLAKDYATAINGLRELEANDRHRTYVNRDHLADNARRAERLSRMNYEKAKRRVDKLLSDSEFMELSLVEATERLERGHYRRSADQLISKMANDTRLVYRTKDRVIATTSGLEGNAYYQTSGTKYYTKANNKSRSKRKKYTDPYYKREHRDEDTKVTQYYY